MKTDQYAVYRVDQNTAGKELWKKPYEQVRIENRQVWIGYYRQISLAVMEEGEKAIDVWKKTRDRTEVSDVLVLNRDGEISCYYVDEDAPRRITGFIRIDSSGAVVTLDTKDYQIEGMEGYWMTTDDIIIDGRQFFLMEHQEYRRQAAMVILDSNGKKIVEACRNGFDQETKQVLHDYIKNKLQSSQRYSQYSTFQSRMEYWQRFFENGHYERSWESGMEVNYDGIDGCVNHQKDHPGKALPDPKERASYPKKRTSVIRKLREKQVAIAKKSGKPIPKFLEQQMEREKRE